MKMLAVVSSHLSRWDQLTGIACTARIACHVRHVDLQVGKKLTLFRAVLGKIIENKPLKGILIEFLIAPVMPLIFGVKTMSLHKFLGKAKPDGT